MTGGCLLSLGELAHSQVVNASFQNGANGYTGTVDRRISEKATDDGTDGSTVASYFLDGYSAATATADASPDAQGLIRFDNLIGNGAGQVPANATILSAKLTLTTSLAGASQT